MFAGVVALSVTGSIRALAELVLVLVRVEGTVVLSGLIACSLATAEPAGAVALNARSTGTGTGDIARGACFAACGACLATCGACFATCGACFAARGACFVVCRFRATH